jgi:hypothetical protein
MKTGIPQPQTLPSTRLSPSVRRRCRRSPQRRAGHREAIRIGLGRQLHLHLGELGRRMSVTARLEAAGATAVALVLGLGLAGCGSASGGQPTQSDAAFRSAVRCGLPGIHPKFIAILVQGVGSSLQGSSFHPATTSFCASANGKMPPDNPQASLRSLADGWLNYSYSTFGGYSTDPSTVGAGHNLMDALANAGGYVLPFSYNGSTYMSGSASSPSFTVSSYGTEDVADSNPITSEPGFLNSEILSIHKVFPGVKILVVGHSNGGLIAEQWWLQYGGRNPEGVVQVFALDAPLNGVGGAIACVVGAGVCDPILGVGPVMAAVYAALWKGQQTYDPTALALDDRDHLFTAVGDLGDPVYDFADYLSSQTLGVKNIGLISQVYWTEPSCVKSGFDLSSRQCTATGQAIINPCGGHNLNDGSGPGFGLPGDLWLHSVVKNCPLVVQAVLYHTGVKTPGPAPARSVTSSPRPAPSPTPSPAPVPGVMPGYSTPQDAVDGFYQSELAGNWGGACSYLEPSAQSLCLSGTSGQAAATGGFTVRTAVIQGSEALVSVTGNICAPSTPCAANTNPSLGMPASPSQFQPDYQAAVASSTSSAVTISPMPCTQIGGKWYVAFG